MYNSLMAEKPKVYIAKNRVRVEMTVGESVWKIESNASPYTEATPIPWYNADKEQGTFYMAITPGKYRETIELRPDVNIDYDLNYQVFAIEVLRADIVYLDS